MSRTIAVVGAGPGLGLAVARAFGRDGFHVGLIARDAARLAADVTTLAADGVTATAHPADIRDRPALRAALESLGPVDVLEYSPGPQGAPITPAVTTTVESATAQFELNVLGAITAAETVLPGMLARGTGSLIFTTGASSVLPIGILGSAGLAMAALRNWALSLHDQLAPRGVHVGTVTIATALAAADLGEVAAHYVDMYRSRTPEHLIGNLDDLRAELAAMTLTEA
ncbi:SDR family NAD(P)-dependent oxidoreductase [Actinoplanes sp. NPDC020271]|uniref:SDR family NAD(P)-dependent oxidoreductase n=1 Tax=Actinoplanes sp. NPDC020271 TaxID=3363896 RepID=UPI0037BBC12A